MSKPIYIHGKAYCDIDKLPLHRLEHLLQLANIELTNYRAYCANYPRDKMEKYGKPHLERLSETRDIVATHLKNKLI